MAALPYEAPHERHDRCGQTCPTLTASASGSTRQRARVLKGCFPEEVLLERRRTRALEDSLTAEPERVIPAMKAKIVDIASIAEELGTFRL